MANIANIGTPQVANRGFVALAVEAGIVTVIQSLVGLALDKRSLIIQIVEALEDSNPELAAAMNMQTLDAILDYVSLTDAAVINASDLPALLDENGPVSVSAGWDGGSASSEQINVTYSEPPAEYTAEIYLDGIFAKHSTVAPAAGYCNDAVSGIQVAISTVRVLYRDGDGNLTRFGTIATL